MVSGLDSRSTVKFMHRPVESARIVRSRLLLKALLGMSLFVTFPTRTVAQTPTAAQNFNRFTCLVVSPDTVLVPATSAAFSQFLFTPAGFDSGADGYGQHFGIALADNIGGKFIRDFGFPTLFREDVTYVPDRSSARTWHRVAHALQHSIVLDGKQHKLNFSGLPASFAAAGLSDLYQPQEQRTWPATLQRTTTNAGGYLLGDLASEFKPELCAIRKRFHVPCK